GVGSLRPVLQLDLHAQFQPCRSNVDWVALEESTTKNVTTPLEEKWSVSCRIGTTTLQRLWPMTRYHVDKLCNGLLVRWQGEPWQPCFLLKCSPGSMMG